MSAELMGMYACNVSSRQSRSEDEEGRELAGGPEPKNPRPRR